MKSTFFVFKLREIKATIQGLINKGFIHRALSLGALFLFLNKKEGSIRTSDLILIHKGVN